MKIKIEIDCDTIGELVSHMYEIIRQVKKESRIFKLDPKNDTFEKKVILDDNNCYGTHKVTIKPE